MYDTHDALNFAIYYFPFFIIFAVFIWYIFAEKKYLGFAVALDRTHKDDKETALDGSVKKIKRYAQVFIVVILLFLPIWSLSASRVADSTIRHERFYLEGGKGTVTGIRDPVKYSIGPTYDIDMVKERMEERSYRWLLDQLDDHVDIDELSKVPGRLALYWLTDDKKHPKRYVVSYTYAAPYPISELYGFKMIEGEGTDLYLEYVGHETYLYPERPNIKAIYDTL